MPLCPCAHARYARAHTHGSPAEVQSRIRTVCCRPPQHEDIHDATHQNASPNICHCYRFRHSNPCPTARGTCRGADIHWCRGSGGRRTCAGRGRASTASCRLPSARGRGKPSGGGSSAASGVWLSPGPGSRILRPLLSAVETWLAPVVIIPSLDAALPCRVDREGLFYRHSG